MRRTVSTRCRAALVTCVAGAFTGIAPWPTPVWADAPAPAASLVYSAASLYNTGNAYARAGNPGLAVLNYERARLLEPSDPDIAANLHFVRTTAHLPSVPVNGFEQTVLRVSPTQAAWAGVLGILLAGTCLLAGHAAPRLRWPRRFGMTFGVLLMALTVSHAVALWPLVHEAVVITAATPVRVSPVPMGDPAFTLPEAETVRLTAEHEGFYLIKTRTGQTGWVARANLAPVVPR